MIRPSFLNSRPGISTIRQNEAADCGLACLGMVMGFHGMEVDLGTLRRRYQLSLRGMSLRGLLTIADRIGLEARAVRCPLKALRRLALPAILHWEMNHFVVLEHIGRRDGFVVHDPAAGRITFSLQEMSDRYTGVAVELKPSSSFQTGREQRRLHLHQLWSKVHGLKRTLAQIVLLTLILQLFTIASPYYLQIAVDKVLPDLDLDLMAVLAIGFAGLTCIHASASLLRGFALTRFGAALGFQIATNLARHLFRLPLFFFEQRNFGDILSRFVSVEPIQRGLSMATTTALVDGLLTVVTLAVMVLYSPALTALAVLAFGVYTGVRIALYRSQHRHDEEAIIAGGRQASVMIESLRGITTLRLYGQEDVRTAMWQARAVSVTNAQVSGQQLKLIRENAHLLIFGLETVASVYFAIRLAAQGSFTTGMLLAFLSYKLQFITKATSLIDQWTELRLLNLHLDRLADIANEQEEEGFVHEAPAPPLAGTIEFRDVTFSYGMLDQPVLKGINLTVRAGEHLAITGSSGGGKSTLLRIVLGLVLPQSGSVVVDGRALKAADLRGYRAQIAAVMQDDMLFTGSLADNITMAEPDADMAWTEACARSAAIHDEIMAMPMRYETLVGNMGAALSGGQRQRVVLARALYRRPRLLVMDEGTAHLDAVTEQKVNAAIAALGITRIVVAHRAETIRNADTVYRHENGRLSHIDTAA